MSLQGTVGQIAGQFILRKVLVIKRCSFIGETIGIAVFITPIWLNYLTGAILASRGNNIAGRISRDSIEFHEIIYKNIYRVEQRIPKIIKILFNIRISQYCREVSDYFLLSERGENYLGDQLGNFGENLRSRVASRYAKLIMLLHQNHQITEKHLQGVKEINQTMGSMVEGFTPKVEVAEKKIQQVAEKVSAQHQKALQLQNEQNQINPEEMETKMDQIKTKLEGLLERRAENFKEAVETLKDFKAAQEHLKNAAQEEKAAQEIVAATITEFNQEPQ